MPPIDVHTLQRLRRILNLSALAEEAGVNKHTLLAKVAKGRALTTDESERIGKVLADSGLTLASRSFFMSDGSVDHVALSKVSREERRRFLASLPTSTEHYQPGDILDVDATIINY